MQFRSASKGLSSHTCLRYLQKLRSMVHEIVGRINGRYGTLTENPIHHLDRQLSFHEVPHPPPPPRGCARARRPAGHPENNVIAPCLRPAACAMLTQSSW